MFRKDKCTQQKSILNQDHDYFSVRKKVLDNNWTGSFFKTIYLATIMLVLACGSCNASQFCIGKEAICSSP